MPTIYFHLGYAIKSNSGAPRNNKLCKTRYEDCYEFNFSNILFPYLWRIEAEIVTFFFYFPIAVIYVSRQSDLNMCAKWQWLLTPCPKILSVFLQSNT